MDAELLAILTDVERVYASWADRGDALACSEVDGLLETIATLRAEVARLKQAVHVGMADDLAQRGEAKVLRGLLLRWLEAYTKRPHNDAVRELNACVNDTRKALETKT